MTWRELKKAIENMQPADLDKTVKYVEPYDKGFAIHRVHLQGALENISDEDGNTVNNGDFYLQ